MCYKPFSLHVRIRLRHCVCVSDCVQAGDASTTRETDPSVPSKEDIPTFDEWKKQVMEVEMEKSECVHH